MAACATSYKNLLIRRFDREQLELGEIASGQPKTDLQFLRSMDAQESQARVIKVVQEKRTHAYLILDQTIFHPKGGGQPSDRGTIHSDEYEVTVKKAIQYKSVVIHWAKLIRGTPTEGEATCTIEWPYRYMVMRRHTAAHLLDHCLAEATGKRVQTIDSWLDEPCYVGYTGSAPSAEALRAAEALANRMIAKGAVVSISVLSPQDAKEMLQNAPNYERLPDLSEVRTVTIEGCQPIPCGGTHVKNLLDVGGVSIARAEPLTTDSYRLHFSVNENVSSS
jgi:alanyl-tRNA synthetase